MFFLGKRTEAHTTVCLQLGRFPESPFQRNLLKRWARGILAGQSKEFVTVLLTNPFSSPHPPFTLKRSFKHTQKPGLVANS